MKLLLATNNAHKAQEIREILKDSYAEILTMREAGVSFEVEEDGSTFRENALKKAVETLAFAGDGFDAVLADDSGLCVDALGGAPGVYSARFTGNHADSDEVRNRFLLEKLKDAEQRSARFVSCICCTLPNGDILRSRGECEGEILRAPRGENGFGYDPVFLVKSAGRSTAELSAEEKNRISHRAVALRRFQEELRDYNAAHQ
jgi:XTP/dITP diphosphohydrolase